MNSSRSAVKWISHNLVWWSLLIFTVVAFYLFPSNSSISQLGKRRTQDVTPADQLWMLQTAKDSLLELI